MHAKRRRDFYKAALASKEPRGDYATAREMLDDLPAIIMQQYGKEGAATASYMIKRHKNRWGRSDCKWLTRNAAFAANGLQRNPDLTPDMKSHFELIVFVAWVFEALRSARAWKSRQYLARSS
jgi:hypothetical protein